MSPGRDPHRNRHPRPGAGLASATSSRSERRIAVVTGAATGIGAAVARALISSGWDVVATRMPGQQAEPGTEAASFVDVDLTSEDAPFRIAERSARSSGADLLVSSAGLSLPGPVELRAGDMLKEFAVNAAAPARLAAALLPQLRSSRGRIVLIGAGQGRAALPFGGGYAASKAGLAAIADALRAEVRRDDVRVSLIEPGAVRTRILAKSRTEADELLASSTMDMRERYGRPLNHTLSAAARAFESAPPPERIADLVVRIATVRKPRLRYLIGREAWGLAVLAHLPPTWRASLIGRFTDVTQPAPRPARPALRAGGRR